MAETREKAPASQDKIPVSDARPSAADQAKAARQQEQRAESERVGKLSEQQADLNVQAFQIETARRTGLSFKEASSLLERLQTEGDFFDEKGRWTLDVAGYPVCHYGWTEQRTEGL